MKDENPSQNSAAGPGPALLRKRGRPRRASEIFRKVSAKTGPGATPRWHDVVLIVCFLIAITLPLAGLVLHLDMAFVLDENRELAPLPELKWDRAVLAGFPAQFEAYWNDNFGFRQRFIHWFNTVKVAVLGDSPNPKVILGRNGWLFSGDVDLEYYRALTPLTPAQLDKWQRTFESRRDRLAARGIPYLVVFAPSKCTMYPEYMPRAYNRVHARSRLDQLSAHLQAHSTLTTIDLRAPLLAEKARAQIYYRTDSHWNSRGAYVGYSRIMHVLCAWFPQLQPIPRSEFRELRISEIGRDLSLLLGMRKYYADNYVDLIMTRPKRAVDVQNPAGAGTPGGKFPTRGPDIIFEHPDQKLPCAVMFRDSFASWLIPLLSEHFRRIVFSWQYSFDLEIVDREHPDVVIQEMAERVLVNNPQRYE
jgi:alginate O-acetyltransferase complex protein AlgJ